MKFVTLLFSLLFSFNTLASLKPGSVIYGVVPCIFGSACFKDVIKKLPYLSEQGVDVLWISPIYQTDDPSHISYAVTDYFKIREDFGSEEDFKTLVQRSHELGMKVILDIVPNHTSVEHPFSQSAMDLGENSPYYHFYERDENGDYTFYFDWENLPNLNFNHPLVKDHITKSFLHWIDKFDVDGFRVDAAWGIRERNPEFWPELVSTLRKKKKDLIMLAEAGALDEYYFQRGFDFAYDWTEEMGQWAWEEVFYDAEKAGSRLHSAIMKSNYKSKVARFINNNDTGERFITEYGHERTRLAALLQHTVPGIPVVYMGDETGAEFDPYDDPAPLNWSDRHKLKGFYRWLSSLKENLSPLHSGEYEKLDHGPAKTIFAFKRSMTNETAIVVTNFGEKAASAQLDNLGHELYQLTRNCRPIKKKLSLKALSFEILVSSLASCRSNQLL